MLVTCLCITRNRRQWLPQAIACFQAQTYEPRELLIAADGEDVSDLIPRDDLRVRLFVLGGEMTVGMKRNQACCQARGEIIANWDDDDFSAPGRLASQVGKLQSTGKAVVGYHTMKFTDGKSWWQYRGNAGIGLGTSLCYRRDWWKQHPFPSQQIGEDSSFVSAAANAQQYVGEGDQDLMYATVHADNTSPRSIILSPDGLWVELPGFQWKEAA